jgi:endo-1,4-beta-xylanase
MQFKIITAFLFFMYVATIFVQCLSAQTITKNTTGIQGDYRYEYWTDYAVGTMTLGDGGNFSCSWDTCHDILFKKGKMPGEKSQIITYSAVFNPEGNAYIGAYGWTKDPLVEYYIVEAWGAWRPPGITSKVTVVSDDGVYDIYETIPHVGLTISDYRQFWSVRQTKRTSGTITCANHFDAWAENKMIMGELHEVMFFVEGYIGHGNVDIRMSMTSGSTAVGGNMYISQSKPAKAGTLKVRSQLMNTGGRRTLTFFTPEHNYASSKVLNLLGQEIGSPTRVP